MCIVLVDVVHLLCSQNHLNFLNFLFHSQLKLCHPLDSTVCVCVCVRGRKRQKVLVTKSVESATASECIDSHNDRLYSTACVSKLKEITVLESSPTVIEIDK